MIVLVTDFGSDGPYQGQMIASLRSAGYGGEIITLFANAPVFSPRYSARLLQAYCKDFPADAIFLCVVDPTVGSTRKPLIAKSNDRWFVGPDNGLFEFLLRSDINSEVFEITWSPQTLSASFHGRDLFAPVAAIIAASGTLDKIGRKLSHSECYRVDWELEIGEVIYIDHYGNCITGLNGCDSITGLVVNNQSYPVLRTFSDVELNSPIVYVNSNGLIEIAINQGRADKALSLKLGSEVTPLF